MKSKSRGSSLLIIEIMLALMFFAIGLTVCVRVLASARQYGAMSRDLSLAVIEAQSIAECYKATDGNIKKSAEILGVDSEGLRLNLYYDHNWNKVPFAAAYSAELVARSNLNGAAMAKVTIYKGSEVLVSFDVAAVKLR